MLLLPTMLLLAWAAWLACVALAQQYPVPWIIRFAVLADPHLFAPALGQDTPAFRQHQASEVKMLDRSVPLFEQLVEDLLAQRPAIDFLLIPGDLSNEGERLSHELAANLLRRLQSRGVAVYVVPGNHDVANPQARRFTTAQPAPVEGLDAAGFAQLYNDFGYARAVSRDRHSLSYIAEPRPGLWLVGLDTCRHADPGGRRIDGGRFRAETLAWLAGQMSQARAEGKQVLAMMHHGAIEHFHGQGEHFPDLLIADWQNKARQLAEIGLQLIFTGHGHAHDISRIDWADGLSLTDVETSSLVTYPNTYRRAELNLLDARLTLRSAEISQAEAGPLAGFKEASRMFSRQMHARHVADTMRQHAQFPAEKQWHLVDALSQAILAHAAGDERPTLQTFREAVTMMKSAAPDDRAVGGLLASLWHDLPPGDHALALNLHATGRANPGTWYSLSAGRRP